jgi:tight adherence protein B
MSVVELLGPGRRVPAAMIVALASLLSLMTRSMMPLLVLPPMIAVLAYRRASRRNWADYDAQREAVAGLCTALRAELEAGLQPGAAFMSAVWAQPALRDLAVRASVPSPALDPARLLAAQAACPGRRALRALAACWHAADRHGIRLTDAVAGVEEGLRAETARARAVAIELAGIRATILLLAALPVFGIALGLALGADPWDMLLHHTLGQLCLIFGVGLDLCGLLWTDRLVAGLRPEPRPVDKRQTQRGQEAWA